MTKKLLLLLLSALMVVACFACQPDKKPSAKPYNPWGDLPDKDYEMREFRPSTRAGYSTLELVCADEESSDLLDIAIMNRNNKVQDAYNIIIEPVVEEAQMGAQINIVLADCISQADKFDIAMVYVFEGAPLITNGYVLNWNTLDYNHLDRSYWMNDMNKQFAVKGVIYTAVSKLCVSTITNTYAFFYNRTLAESLDANFTDELFDTIRSGGWNYDYLMGLVNEYDWEEDDDTNGRSEGDFYTFRMSRDWSIDTWHAAWDIPMIKNDPEKGLTDVMMTDKYLNYASRMNTMYYETNGIYYGNMASGRNAIQADKCIFTTDWLDATLGGYDNMESIYTILPYPKYDENQKSYLTPMVDNYSVMTVPNSADDEFVSIIVEALSIASEESVYPAYYVEALQGRYVSDPDTLEMLDYVLNNITWDIATLLNAEVGMMTIVRDAIVGERPDTVEKTYNEKRDDIQEALEYIMEQFEYFQ